MVLEGGEPVPDTVGAEVPVPATAGTEEPVPAAVRCRSAWSLRSVVTNHGRQPSSRTGPSVLPDDDAAAGSGGTRAGRSRWSAGAAPTGPGAVVVGVVPKGGTPEPAERAEITGGAN